MRARRKYEGQDCIFDAVMVLHDNHPGQELIKMVGQQASYDSPSGTRFYKEHPYQWVPNDDVPTLLSQNQPSFKKVTIEEVEDYYSIS